MLLTQTFVDHGTSTNSPAQNNPAVLNDSSAGTYTSSA